MNAPGSAGVILLTIALRYLFIAGIFWTVWYVLIRKRVAHRKIQPRFPAAKDYQREIGYSLLTIVIFAAFPVVLLLTPLQRYTQYYRDIHAHSMLYFWLALPLIFIIQDAYFYWMHRLMHHPKLFRLFHLVHHKSTNPTPWAAMAFHPLEAVAEGGIFALLLFIMPIHMLHIVIFFAVMLVYNVYGHLGWGLYPKGFTKHPVGRWINTSVNHNQHNQYFKGNYALYFLWWDRWMGTIHADYDVQHEAVKSRSSMKKGALSDTPIQVTPECEADPI